MSPRRGHTVRGGLAFAAAMALLVLSGGRRTSDASTPGAAGPGASGPGASASLPAAVARSSGAPDPGDLEEGRKILSRHCASCHSPGLPTTVPGALAVFSLNDTDWTAHMTPKQMCASDRRMHGTSHEPDEVRIYSELVARLLARRGAPPCGA